MKRFDNEVLTFDPSSSKSMSDMAQTLREWGESGFQVVSVVDAMTGSSPRSLLVFLTRERVVEKLSEVA